MNIKEALAAKLSERTRLDREIEQLKRKAKVRWPREYSVYIYGAKAWEDDCFISFIHSAGWDYEGEQAEKLSDCSHEHKMTYAVWEDGSSKLIAVDDIPLQE